MSQTEMKEKTERNSPPRFFAELERRGRTCAVTVSGIVAVSEFSSEAIGLVCRGGRMRVLGEELKLLTLENRTAEVRGKILGVSLSYGKN